MHWQVVEMILMKLKAVANANICQSTVPQNLRHVVKWDTHGWKGPRELELPRNWFITPLNKDIDQPGMIQGSGMFFFCLIPFGFMQPVQPAWSNQQQQSYSLWMFCKFESIPTGLLPSVWPVFSFICIFYLPMCSNAPVNTILEPGPFLLNMKHFHCFALSCYVSSPKG